MSSVIKVTQAAAKQAPLITAKLHQLAIAMATNIMRCNNGQHVSSAGA